MRRTTTHFWLGCLVLGAAFALPAQEAAPTPVQAAEDVALRNQEQAVLMRKRMADAQTALQRKDLDTASRLLEDALSFANKVGPAVAPEQARIVAALIDVRLKLADRALDYGKPTEAQAQLDRAMNLDKNNPRVREARDRIEREIAELARLQPTPQTVEKAAPDLKKQHELVNALVQDGRFFFEEGRLEEAEAKLKQAYKLDPDNMAANHYLRLVSEAKFTRYAKVREKDSAAGFVEVEEKWLKPVKGETLPQPNPFARSIAVTTGKGRQAIMEKLERTTFDQIGYDLRLEDVLKDLVERVRRQDPEKKGLNFLLSPNVEPGAAEGELADIMIKIAPDLYDVRLIDLLDVIVKVSKPRVKYSIEDYAIVFTPAGQDQAALFTRTFRVDPNTFMQGLQGVEAMDFGVGSAGGTSGSSGSSGNRGGGSSSGGRGGGSNGSQSQGNSTYAQVSIAGSSGNNSFGGGGNRGGGGGGGQSGGGIRFLTETNITADLGQMVRTFFQTAGVEIAAPKAFFYNDRNGLLMVRANLGDLDIIEQALQVLTRTPQQVTIEARFVDLSLNDMKALGFDWWLGRVNLTSGVVGQGGSMPSLVPAAGAVNNGLPGSNGAFPGPASAGSSGVSTAGGGQLATQRDNLLASGIQLPDQYGVTHTVTTGSSGSTAFVPPVATITGILTDPQFRVVISALEQRNGSDLLACPRITTLSGRQTQMKAVDVKSIVVDLTVGNNVSSGGGIGGGGNAAGGMIQPVAEAVELGPVLDVIPVVSADGYTIQMTIIPTYKEFLGYDLQMGQFWSAQVQSVTTGGNGQISTPTPLPSFRLRQLATSAIVWDGQTVVLGGLLSDSVFKSRDKIPVLGDLPLLGRLFRSDSGSTFKRNLMIFVTPTMIDAAGNPLHSAEEMPFAQTSVPTQKAAAPTAEATPVPSAAAAPAPAEK